MISQIEKSEDLNRDVDSDDHIEVENIIGLDKQKYSGYNQ